ncbi:MAG TPA: hypothetical protein DEG06_04350, partial [Lachnospiraceae bacterium]|nr:hypothetical protein [Lachnospiraceae bacterium]
LHNIELTGALSKLLSVNNYPTEELEELWETLLRNQFHDILPGSSILEVYQDSQKEYEKMFSQGNQLLDENLNLLSNHINASKDSVV